MATSEDLVTAVMEDLEERGTGQPIAEEDAEKVRVSLPYCFADLLGRNVILQPISLNDIDDAQFLHLKVFVAWKNARAFGLSGDAVLAAEAIEAEERLRTLARINRGTKRTLTIDTALTRRRVGW